MSAWKDINLCCAYCGEHDELNLAKCLQCSQWFCNSPLVKKGTHVGLHMLISNHSRISLHPRNPYSSDCLTCCVCGTEEALCTVENKAGNKLICRGACFNPLRGLRKPRELELQLKEVSVEMGIRPEVLEVRRSAMYGETFEAGIEHEEYDMRTPLRVPHMPCPITYPIEIENYQNQLLKHIKTNTDLKTDIKGPEIRNVKVVWTKNPLRGCMRIPKRVLSYYSHQFRITSTLGWTSQCKFIEIDGSLLIFEVIQPHGFVDMEGLYTVEPILGINFKREDEAVRQLNTLHPPILATILGGHPQDHQPVNDIDMEVANFFTLDTPQIEALKSALSNPVTIVEGASGTGKTWLAAAIIESRLAQVPSTSFKKVLACAPSNSAADALAQILDSRSISVVRVIPKSKACRVSNMTLESLIRKTCSDRVTSLLDKLECDGELTDRESKELRYQVSRDELNIIMKADVICCTCISSYDSRLKNIVFDFVILDDATHIGEPASLCPLSFGVEHLVMLGDCRQTDSFPKLHRFGEIQFSTSLFERLISIAQPCITLKKQHRMNPEIFRTVSPFFYGEAITSGVEASERRDLVDEQLWPLPANPVIFCEHTNISSKFNFENIAIGHFLKRFKSYGIPAEDIGVVTFTKGQAIEATRWVSRHCEVEDDDEWYRHIDIDNGESFIGLEKRYTIVSTIPTNQSTDSKIMSDARRINVTISRAKNGLIIIGNIEYLVRSPEWKDLIETLKEQGLSFTLDECLEKFQYSQDREGMKGVLRKDNFTHQTAIERRLTEESKVEQVFRKPKTLWRTERSSTNESEQEIPESNLKEGPIRRPNSPTQPPTSRRVFTSSKLKSNSGLKRTPDQASKS